MSTIDRTATAQALAKTIAYLACGKRGDAAAWFRRLASLLGMQGMLR
jgi:hypothetical protein